ncbi:MAG: CBU_0585 family protein [Kangiellaceae bacterium]|jgi:hypothetical protein|nr:CBU_0585 family protein [Kangiellaceae bacterium]
MSINRTYTSEMGDFLTDLNTKKEMESESVRAEKEKYDKINELRDNQQADQKKPKIWQGF